MRRRGLLLLTAAWVAGARAQDSASPTQDVNLANQAELEMLPGVGPALSEALLAERARGGRYRSWPDLVSRVKGLGPAKARAMSRAGLRVDGQAWPG